MYRRRELLLLHPLHHMEQADEYSSSNIIRGMDGAAELEKLALDFIDIIVIIFEKKSLHEF